MKKFFKAPALVLVALAFTVASCGGGWSDDDKKKFMDKCSEGASAMGEAGEKYCQCMLDKIVEKYPDPKTVDKDMDKEWMQKEAMKCLSGGEE